MGNFAICIGREYGSGGREVGETLAHELNIPCYDKLLIKQELAKDGVSGGVSDQLDEKLPTAILSGNAFADTAAIMQNFYFADGQAAYAVQRTLKRLVAEQSCVIIGRCASVFLAGLPLLSVFIYADDGDCLRRIEERNHISEEEARKRFKQINRLRRQYFDFYSDTGWGKPESYDLMLSSSALGIEGCVELIRESLSYRKAVCSHE